VAEDEEPTLVGTLAERALEAARARGGLVDVEDLDADEAEQLGVRTPEEHLAYRWSATIPQRFHAACVGDLERTQSTVMILEWAARPDGRNLVLLGPTGVGKTHAAVAACRPSFERGLSVLFMPAVELFDQLRPGGPDDALDALLDADRLVIDDLGSERPTGWTNERLYLVVNRRWLDLRPTVITTNLEPKTLELEVGERMFSRMVGSGAVVVRLTGPDLRRKRA